jgi:predicted  nucleic acid-binding Zn-ribbon protein
MAKLEQLEKDVLKAQERIDSLREKQARAEQALIDSPDNDKAALDAAAVEMQVKAAEAGKRKAQEAVHAERLRLRDQELEQVKAKLAEIEGQVDAIREKHTAQALEILNDFEVWSGLLSQYDTLAQHYQIRGKDLRNLDLIHGGMIDLYQSLQQWKNKKDLVDYRRANHG